MMCINQSKIYLLLLNYTWDIYVIVQHLTKMLFLMYILSYVVITGKTEHLC
ncbi:hypothetical protein SDC9_188149 [bioreactor metagenome]|uniref:Uncharacterized protein n=1 Tax=bioreactor metagenome TaxID=1076179 RepID=A0A645HNI2_9ZZZZ